MGLNILYQDGDLLVIDKPAGLRVVQDGYHPELPSIRALLDAQFGKVFIVHRLDKDTSGVLLVAKNAFVHRSLNLQFEKREVEKEYHAIVITPTGFPKHLTIDQPLRVDGDRRHRTVVDNEHGKPALTEFICIEPYSMVTLVKALPKTGYTHQIRAHAANAGFPLLGDRMYTFPGKARMQTVGLPEFPRPALHAFSICFRHPRTAVLMTLSAEYPPDFSRLLEELNK